MPKSKYQQKLAQRNRPGHEKGTKWVDGSFAPREEYGKPRDPTAPRDNNLDGRTPQRVTLPSGRRVKVLYVNGKMVYV